MVLWSCFSSSFFERLGYHCCEDHFKMTTMAFVMPLQIFAVIFPNKLKRGKDITKFSVLFDWKDINCYGFGVWFPRNMPIILVIYTGGKWVSTKIWSFLKQLSAEFWLNSLTEVSNKTVCLSILCYSWYPHILWCTSYPKLFCDFITNP